MNINEINLKLIPAPDQDPGKYKCSTCTGCYFHNTTSLRCDFPDSRITECHCIGEFRADTTDHIYIKE